MKFIATNNYLLMVEEKISISPSDTILCWIDGKIRKNNQHIAWTGDIILAHTPLNNSPLLEGIDVLPEIGERGYSISVEDIKKAWELGNDYGDVSLPDAKEAQEKFIKSLSTSKIPTGFIPETRQCHPDEGCYLSESTDNNVECAFKCKGQPKKLSLPNGTKQWVGKYIYE